MRPRHRIATALALLVAALAVPAAAHASGADVVRDCTLDGELSKSYSTKEISDALANLPADVDEYSDCRDVLRRALLNASGGSKGGSGGSSGGGGTGGGGASGGSGGGGGSAGAATGDPAATAGANVDPLAAASPQERASFQRAVQAGAAPVQLDGRPVTPGTLGGTSTSGLSDLPTPLLVVLALLVLGGLGALGAGTRRLVLGRRPA